MSSAQQKWNRANAEKIKAYRKEWDLKNKINNNKNHNDWKKANPEKVVAQHKRYYLKLSLANKSISRRTLAAWAEQVKEKDCYTCRDCGSTENLHAHHIWSKGSHPQYALDLDNGTTLCEECHIYEHRINGKK